MTDRHTVDTITSDALDALYAECDEARETLRLLDAMRQQNLDSAAAAIQRAEQAEAAIARARQVAARIRQGAPWTANDDDIADHIETALKEPTP